MTMKKEEKKQDIAHASSMSEKEMNDYLVGLHSMPQWQAVLRYYSVRNVTAEASLFTIDPFKEPTLMARNQGIRIGLMDLPRYINEQIKKRKKADDPDASHE